MRSEGVRTDTGTASPDNRFERTARGCLAPCLDPGLDVLEIQRYARSVPNIPKALVKKRKSHGAKTLLKLTLLLAAAFSTSYPYNVESTARDTKYLRIVGKIGSPNLAGLEVEGIVPGIGNWLGVWTGFTHLPIGNGESTENGEVVEKTKGGLNHFGAGFNFYMPGDASGVYLSTGYDRVSAYDNVVQTQTGKKDMLNPTQMISTQLGYKYIGSMFTYSFFGGYGFNFGYKKPVQTDDETILFNKGNWIQAGVSFGVAFPFTRD